MTIKNNNKFKLSKEHNIIMDIDSNIIIDDLMKLKNQYLLPVHLNIKKDETIKIKNGKPSINKRKRSSKPSICYVYCPFCKKLLNRTNIYKNSNHFQLIHGSLPNNVKQQLLDIIRLNGLKYYRTIQFLSIYKKSNNEIEKEKLADLLEGNSINSIGDSFIIRFPNIDFNLVEETEFIIKIFQTINKNIIIDYINTLVLNNKNNESIQQNSSKTRNVFKEINSIEIFNNIEENGEKIHEDDNFLEKVIILSPILQKGNFDMINELTNDLSEERKIYLIKNAICYSMAILSFTKKQSDFINNAIKIWMNLFKIDEKLKLSYSSCHRKWLKFLDIMKNNIKELNKSCDCFSLMIDETSQYNVKIIMIIANYKIGNLYMKKLIKLQSLDDTSTSENINELIHKQLIELEFDLSKFKGICTDGCASMIKLCVELKNKYSQNDFIGIHCFCHRLNIAIQHVIKNSNCEIVKVIVSWFETSNVLTMYKQYIKHLKIKQPPRNCPTRWEYYVDSIDYILNNMGTIEMFLNSKNDLSDLNECMVNIRVSLMEKTKELKDKPRIVDNMINIKGLNNKIQSLFVALSIIFNEVKLTIRILEMSSMFLSDGLRVIFAHIKRFYVMKKEMETKKI